MTLEITTLAQRPELAGAMWNMPDTWPEYIGEDRVGWSFYGRIPVDFPEFVLIATDADLVVAQAFSIPFALHIPGREVLPPGGWAQALMWAFSDQRHDRATDTVSAIQITVHSDHLGRGLSWQMLTAMRDNARRLGFAELVAPLRPTGKHVEPDTQMSEYAWRTRDDGLPADAWIRNHVRNGAVIDSVAPTSMVVAGSLAEWRRWTGLPFDTDGDVMVPQALSPVRCDLAADYAVYIEPNVWVRHGL